MKLYVDDERPAPKGWELCTSRNQAVSFISQHKNDITHISLDHDNGDTFDGFKPVARYIGKIYKGRKHPIVTVHSANPIGAKELILILKDYGIEATRI